MLLGKPLKITGKSFIYRSLHVSNLLFEVHTFPPTKLTKVQNLKLIALTNMQKEEQWTVEAATKRNSGNRFSGSLNQILEKYLWMCSFVRKFLD